MSKSGNRRLLILSRTIRPQVDSDWQTLLHALSEIARQDLAVRIQTLDQETLLSGADELHLQSICDRLLQEYKIHITAGAPVVIYLETVRRHAVAEARYIRQTGGSSNYAHVRIRLEPNERGEGLAFFNETKGGVVPKEFIHPTEMGVRKAAQAGILRGFEVVDVKVTLFDGSFHEVDSHALAFEIAGSMAFKEAARKAAPVVLEPVMAVKITVQEGFMGTIIADLNRRRGRIEEITNHGATIAIRALVPLAMMLRSSTQAWGNHSALFAQYEQMPDRPDSEGDGAGVTADRPKWPKAGSGSAALRRDADN